VFACGGEQGGGPGGGGGGGGTTKNGRDKDSEKDVDNNLQLCALSATGIMYEDVI